MIGNDIPGNSNYKTARASTLTMGIETFSNFLHADRKFQNIR